MARGWESKSVEEQQADALENRERRGRYLSPEEQALRRKIDGLELSRKAILRQLESATHARHRHMLEESLAELERQIRQLETT